MEFSAEWKSLWPISSTFSAPLLVPNKITESHFGPVIFTPKPDSSTTLVHSPALSPCLPPPYPQLSLSRFLQNYNSVPASATSISSLLGPQLPNYSSYFHGFNSLQLLQVPNKSLIVAFFPTGENSEHVGFSLLSVKDGILSVHSAEEDSFRTVIEGNVNHQRITRLLVISVDDFYGDDILGDASNVKKHKNVVTVLGFLMVCTHYSVSWYRVQISTVDSVSLDYLGSVNAKMLRGKSVVCACWSPHLSEECLVLLENGDLLLFDINSCSSEKKLRSLSFVTGNNRVVHKKLKVSLTHKLGDKKSGSWFGCEFSWHPRIFIVSHQNEVFLVDLRNAGDCNISCLLKLEMLSMGKNDEFCTLSKAGFDGFTFTVATRYLLLLCDVRKPLMPVLRWTHGIQNPRYMTFCKLSDLRVNAEDNKYKSFSESGYSIILGSFWDDEFGIFCYGPNGKENESIFSEISRFCNSYFAWGLPSNLPLSDNHCSCGNCLVRDEFLNASRPIWIDWRQKKSLTLGFGIIEPSLSSQLSSLDGFGSFTLIRLTSSGKLEAQTYTAGWESEKFSKAGHKRKIIYYEDNLLYDCKYSEYDMKKKFQHLKFEFLDAYMKGNLAKYIVERRGKKKEKDEDCQKKQLLSKSKSNFHHEICHRLKEFGFPKSRSSLEISTVLKDVNLPTSIHEIALRSMCAALPTNLLQLGFSTYSDLDENPENEPLEFLDIPDQIQVPPFPFRNPSIRSNKWSSKTQPSDAFVGPILPPHFLTTLYNLSVEELKDKREPYPEESEAFSAHAQFKLECHKVKEVVQEHVSVSSDANTQENDNFVSLADDTENMIQETKKLKFCYHKPSAFLENSPSSELGFDDQVFSTHVFRRNQDLDSDLSAEMVGRELFDFGCPIELKFDDGAIDLGPNELEAFRKLKKLDLDFQKSCKPYQDYLKSRDEPEQE